LRKKAQQLGFAEVFPCPFWSLPHSVANITACCYAVQTGEQKRIFWVESLLLGREDVEEIIM
jgi:hypothetical protein